jgi:hypothetical protein
MNYYRLSKSTAKEFQFTLLTLAVGLACWSSVALAGNPIPGVDVNLGKNPGGIMARTKTDKNGLYQFNKLAPGTYELCIGDKPCKSVIVGPDGTLRGQIPLQAVPQTIKR